jgi:hypothetical protein
MLAALLLVSISLLQVSISFQKAINMTTPQGSQSSSNGDVVVQAKAPSDKLGSLSAMTKNSEGYGTHNKGKKQMMISAERKMAPRFLFGVFLTIFM